MTWSVSTDSLKQLIELERERRRRRAARPSVAPSTPLEWAVSEAQIVHPAQGRIAFAPYPYQRTFMNAYDQPRRLILKARQIGFSQVFALEALYTAITQPEQTILLVSRSQDLAVNLLRYCYLTYNNLKHAPELRKANESEMGYTNGSRIKSIPANRSTGRGFAANAVYLDEFAYAEYADEIYQSVSPSISQGGRLVIGSTPNGVGNLFHTLYLTSEGFTRFIEPWHHCPMYWTQAEQDQGIPKEQSAWFLKERPKYTAQQWAAEYECDFIGSGEAVFSADAIASARTGATGDQLPVGGHRYVTSVDIGRRQDATVINTFDTSVTPFQRVAHERIERIPYPVIQQKIETRARTYPGALWIESNGVGDPVIENLQVSARPFVTTARSKVQALQSLALLLERGTLKAEWTAQEQYELTIYRYDDRDLVQDCVMSLAIGADALAGQRSNSAVGMFAR
jgi:Terminase large subunit, T4likevirus-type, N-terminal